MQLKENTKSNKKKKKKGAIVKWRFKQQKEKA